MTKTNKAKSQSKAEYNRTMRRWLDYSYGRGPQPGGLLPVDYSIREAEVWKRIEVVKAEKQIERLTRRLRWLNGEEDL